MHCASILTVSPPFHLPSFFPRDSVQASGCIPAFAKSNFRELSDYSSKIFRNVYAKLYRNLEAGRVSDFEDGIETISLVLYSFMRFLVQCTTCTKRSIDRTRLYVHAITVTMQLDSE